ncbi:hypothetical protein IFM89_028567 [Coptis chinensis]|uniref:Uncharacterized protein n=1 Tax=Coptis chinensis TaxID=261450 RepID=A0A835IEE7_9MAGN|nr:hypothetical protein IFM89_028567 [Coptis chinensis]
MAHAVISGVLEQLRSILQTDQVNLLAGVRKESEKLNDTLVFIQAVVEDAEEKQVNNAVVKVWLERLTRILYDADDVLDDWNTRIQQLDAPISGEVLSGLFSQFSCLNERLDRIVKNKALLPNLSESQSREEPLRSTSSFVDDSEIYGRVDDIYSIVNMLLSETDHQDSHVPLISVVGTGGFGKTTLVQLILIDGQVTKNFEKLMWVSVSKPFDLERVAKSIIKKATGDVPSTVDWEDLHECLSESVRAKKFLLVLDDVWTYDPEIWRKLRVSLDGGAQGSRIIITTRDENIAKRMTSTYIHRLGQLSDEECWSFFKHIALREIQDNHEKFEEIGKKIAWKCKGVPLAVKIVASLMHIKGSIREWEDVLASDIWEVMSEDEHGFLPSLLLSYYALPSRLKRCFSYCAIFREDAEIYKDELVKLWMAQGFLSYDSSKDLEKIGTNYFNDLAMRSLFQDFEKDSEGNVIRCKMHDFVHDFVQHLAKSESSIFMQNDREVVSIFMKNDREGGNIKLRHLDVANVSGARLKLIICRMTCLRVLDLSETSLKELPDEVERLLHLRLLDLSRNREIKELPETVCNLFNLQTLKLNRCYYLWELPEGIGKLRNLRHLELEETQLSYFPRGLERLSCLRTLSKVVLDRDGGKGCQIGELKLLDHIQGKLRIERLGQGVDSKAAKLKKKEKLRSLDLQFYRSLDLRFHKEIQNAAAAEEKSVLDGLQPHTNLAELHIEAYGGNNFPLWMSGMSSINTYLPNLVKLELEVTRCSELPALGRLQNLERLALWNLVSVKRIGSEFYGLGSTDGTTTGEDSIHSVVVFPKLHTLQIKNLDQCEEWHLPFRRGVEIFPKLRRLTVQNLMKLQMLPPGLGKLKSLEELTLFDMPEWDEQGDKIKLPIRRDEEGGEGFIMPCLRELVISLCRKLKVVPHYLFSPALRILKIWYCPQLTGRQPCLPPLLEELDLDGDTGILSKSILPLLISGIGSPDHSDTTNNENDYPNLHSFSICHSRQLSLPQGFNKLTAIQTLKFSSCIFLDFTPEDLKHLPKLQLLGITSCPILEERCRKRESWTTNSHIPKIVSYGKYTQDRVLVKIKSAEEKTVGGILLPFTARSKPQGGEVVAVGEARSKPQGGELVAVGEGKTLGKNKLEITVKDWSANCALQICWDRTRVLSINSIFIEGSDLRLMKSNKTAGGIQFISFLIHKLFGCFRFISRNLLFVKDHIRDMPCSFFNIIGYASSCLFLFFCLTVNVVQSRIHHKESSAMLRDIAHISFVWLLCFGLQQLHSLFIVLSLDIKLMLKIWSHCFTCMFGAVHFIAFYAPLWGAILFNGLTYFQVIRMINNATRVCLWLHQNYYRKYICSSWFKKKYKWT